MTVRPSRLILSLAVALVSACGGQSAATTAPQATIGPGGQPSATAAPQATPGQGGQPQTSAAAGAGTATAHLEVGSGPQAGSYDATGIKSDCNLSSTGSGATYVDTTKTTGLTSFVFSSIGGGPDSSKFYFQAAFGAITLSQPVVEISTLDPASAGGKGTAHLDDKGGTIRWTLDGSAKDGVTIKGFIECGPVDRV